MSVDDCPSLRRAEDRTCSYTYEQVEGDGMEERSDDWSLPRPVPNTAFRGLKGRFKIAAKKPLFSTIESKIGGINLGVLDNIWRIFESECGLFWEVFIAC